jgi:uncharacterized delta-60 repeat protein
VLTDFPSGGLSGFEIVSALAVQPDGTLVAAGGRFTADVGSDVVVLRYNRDGTLDQRFGDDGRVRTSFNRPAVAVAVLVQPDGKVVAAVAVETDEKDFALARYNRDGSLDASFGTAGRVLTDFGARDTPTALVLQPDGKLVAAGYRDLVSGFLSSGLALARYNPDGSLDSSFGSGGLVVTDVGQPVPGESFTGANALVLQPDGKLVAAGQAGRIFDDDFFLARYNPDGSLDTSFGAGGLMVTDFGQPSRARALVLQPDGKLVAAGAIGVEAPGGGIVNSSLARFNPDGSPDTSFGDSGLVVTNFGDNRGADALVLQPDGKLVTLAAGFVVARYGAHGSLDASFGNGGLVRHRLRYIIRLEQCTRPSTGRKAGGRRYCKR